MGSNAHSAETGKANRAARNRIRRTGLLLRTYRRPAVTEWPSGSRSTTGFDGGRFHTSNAPMTTAKDTALIANTACGPTAATSSPAIGGPSARAASTATPLTDAAAGDCSRGAHVDDAGPTSSDAIVAPPRVDLCSNGIGWPARQDRVRRGPDGARS